MRDFDKTPCVYILASRRNGTLYIGVTSDLFCAHRRAPSRIWIEGFTKKYGVHMLVYYEMHETHGRGNRAREAAQGVAAGMENPPDREHEPGMD